MYKISISARSDIGLSPARKGREGETKSENAFTFYERGKRLRGGEPAPELVDERRATLFALEMPEDRRRGRRSVFPPAVLDSPQGSIFTRPHSRTHIPHTHTRRRASTCSADFFCFFSEKVVCHMSKQQQSRHRHPRSEEGSRQRTI